MGLEKDPRRSSSPLGGRPRRLARGRYLVHDSGVTEGTQGRPRVPFGAQGTLAGTPPRNCVAPTQGPWGR